MSLSIATFFAGEKEKFNVVFLGGSITAGGRASAYTNSWTYKVGEYLKNRFINKDVNIFNAGVGGTGSMLGNFRLQKDVIAREADLVFVEYAVNDMGEQPDDSRICFEGIVRQLQRLEKPPSVIFIYTTTSTKSAVGLSVQQKIADYYQIPSIDLQKPVWDEIEAGKYRWEDIGADTVHPNDAGHRIYADFIIRSLSENEGAFFRRPVIQATPLMDYEFKNPRLVSYSSAFANGDWKVEKNSTFRGKLDETLGSSNIGDSLELSFTGKSIGLYHVASRDAGIAEITVDEETFSVDLYKNMDVPYSLFRKIHLEDKTHKIRVKVGSTRNSQSTGNWIRLGYFLVD